MSKETNHPLPSFKHPLTSSTHPLLFLGLALGIFLILKLYNLAPKLSDEGFYFYTAKLVSEGQLPYQDFFFQHLPGQILFLAGLIKVFGYNLYLLKTIPILASLGTAFLLYRLTQNFTTSILYLFSLSVLATTDHSTGVHEAVFLLVLFWYLLENLELKTQMSKPQLKTQNLTYIFLAGITLFLGLSYRIYILPAALGITLYYLWKQIRLSDVRGQIPGSQISDSAIWQSVNRYLKSANLNWLVFLLSSLIPYVALNLFLWKAYGEKFLTPVWRYHFLKTEGIDKGKIISFFLANEWMLLVLTVAGVVILIQKLQKKSVEIGLNQHAESSDISDISVGRNTDFSRYSDVSVSAIFGLFAQSLFLLVFVDIYYFYLVILIPFLAVLATHSIRSLMTPMSPSLTSPKSLILFLAAFAALNFYNYQTNHAPVSVITNLDRIKGDVKGLTKDPTSSHRSFSEGGLRGAGTIWGSFLVTPLIALGSDRKITENQVDTNAKRNYAGFLSADEATRLATESSLFIQTATLDTSGKILALEPNYVKQYVIADSCTLFRTYPIPRDYEKNAILLWQCQR